jgi:hypothetical protein
MVWEDIGIGRGMEDRVKDLIEKSETIRYYVVELKKKGDYERMKIYHQLLELIKESDFGRKEAEITIKTMPLVFFNICSYYLSGYGELSLTLLDSADGLCGKVREVKVNFRPAKKVKIF